MSSYVRFWLPFLANFLTSLHPNSENLRIPWFHRTLDLALWIHCFPNLLSCVIDWLRWEDLSTQYVDALCCSAYALEPGWAQIISPRWIPNPDNLRRRGLSNIVWLLCSMTWDYMSPLFSIWGIWGNLGMLGLISTAHTQKSTHSTGDIALRAHIQKSSYSARILRNHRTRQMGAHTAKIGKNRKKRKKKKKEPAEVFFSFFSFSAKKPWNLIIWNMGEIVVFPAFWAVAHTIAFHEIQVV